jgi:hypothetical protein
MHRKMLTAFICLLLAACSAVGSTTPTSAFTSTMPSLTAVTTERSTITHFPTFTRWPTLTASLTPTFTLTPTITQTPSPTRTANLTDFRTATRAPAAVCPKLTSEKPTQSDIDNFKSGSSPGTDYAKTITEILNRFGPDGYYGMLYKPDRGLENQDFTNDGVADIFVLDSQFGIYIFGCKDGSYAPLFAKRDYSMIGSNYIVTVRDSNRNGIPEITYVFGHASKGGHNFETVEWDGNQFQNVFSSELVKLNGNVYFEDLNGDGREEIYTDSGIPDWTMFLCPCRHEYNYYVWNGYQFVQYRFEYSLPEYRFQAVQDGDRFTQNGAYDRALAMYQDAINGNTLKWWSPEVTQYYLDLARNYYSNTPVPAPSQQDINEYYSLAAYSYYRIMLLQILQGKPDQAQYTLSILTSAYSEGKPGYVYTEMALAFWNEYQATQNLPQACGEAIKYAKSHEQTILYYLGAIEGNGVYDANHGWQSLVYTPESVCPFK